MSDEEKMISVPEKDFSALLARVAAIENVNKSFAPKRVTEREATIRIWEGLPVLRLHSVETNNPMARNEVSFAMADLLNEDGTTRSVQVNYLEFLNRAEIARVKILSQVAKPVEYSQGKVEYRHPANDSVVPGQFIDLAVTSVEYVPTVEVLDGPLFGKTFTLGASSLNI